MTIAKTVLRYVLAIVFVAAGVNHFLNAAFYIGIMPPFMPRHAELVYLSGVIEIGLGLLLLFRRTSAWAGWGCIALLIAVFPANVHMALNPQLFPAVSPLALWARLPFQAVFIAWAFWFTRSGG